MATLFKTTDYEIKTLIDDVDHGDLALPDIQRPFVWTDTKIRDLFDSLLKGYPIGYLLFWENYHNESSRVIGTLNGNDYQSVRLIIDGQQRLTALYAVIKGKIIIDKDFQKRRVKIGFNPLKAKFVVADASTERNNEFIPDISQIWENNALQIYKNYIDRLKTKKEISDEEENLIFNNINALFNIEKYKIVALEMPADLDEEVMADIFVRINNQGTKLSQSDFVMTLLSVYWQEGRSMLEQFSHETIDPNVAKNDYSAFNHIMKPAPEDLLRVAVGYSFKRGKMKDVYLLLRGKDFETKEFSTQLRDERFNMLKESVNKTLDNTNWHSFVKSIGSSGYVTENLISSKNAALFSYIFYLIGKYEYSLDSAKLQRLIAKWFVFTSISLRYSSSAETALEADLARLRTIKTAEQFHELLEKIMGEITTNDFWNITFPSQFETSSASSPHLNAYYASLIKLNAPVLFSNKRVSDLIASGVNPRKKFLEGHHIFPKEFLIREYGFDANKDKVIINQIANFTYLEFEDNIKISDDDPKIYYEYMKDRFDQDEFRSMLSIHAIPDNFYALKYDDFLKQRRYLMAQVIKKAFNQL